MNPTTPLSYSPDLLHYSRRMTREVMVGNVGVGGENPIRVQSMITSDTRDTPACVAEVLGLAAVGCEIVRITAQTKIYAANLENIAREVRAAGCHVPLVADIHFKPDAALEAAKWVEKVRVNPGNYADKKKFEIREYSDAQYEEELERICEEFAPLVLLCKDLGRAMRIGTNHGSLSDRIMNRYGDTPLGMVESALEFARIARDHDYHALVFSMKASNPKVMIEAYRLLVARLHAEGADWNYPIHLGVTEAGDGEDGRIKSAIGIGSLLADGIGDTVRVSLTEDSVFEIPVARALVGPFNAIGFPPTQESSFTPSYDPFSYERRRSSPVTIMGHALGGENTVRVFTTQDRWNALAHKISSMGDFKPEIIVEKSGVVELDPNDDEAVAALNGRADPCLVTVSDSTDMEIIPAFRLLSSKVDARHPILLKDTLLRGCGILPQATPSLKQDSLQRFIDPNQRIEKTRATHLPHWTQGGGIYSVTFRLADSLPAEVLEAYRRERSRIESETDLEKRNPDPNPNRLADLERQLAGLYESSIGAALDAGTGACHLRDERVAAMLVGALRHFDGQRYRLIAWCLMPNHVHMVIQPLAGQVLDKILHSIKSFSANAANELLGRTGIFWQKESYDHLIRDGVDYQNQIRYLLKNPENAKLPDWPWVGSIYGNSWDDAKRSCGILPQEPADLRQDAAATLLPAAQNLGSLLCDGIGDAILVRGETAAGQSLRLAYNILQAAGTRIFKTDYVACPSCGRTLFNLQSTTQKIRAATGHLKGVRIAVMGCIVNGPGEMADADFGYVGGAPNKINLYVGKTAVKFNIPEAEAVERLTDLIREHGKWVDAPEPAAAGA